jgi:hypothetical protein
MHEVTASTVGTIYDPTDHMHSLNANSYLHQRRSSTFEANCVPLDTRHISYFGCYGPSCMGGRRSLTTNRTGLVDANLQNASAEVRIRHDCVSTNQGAST